MKKTDKHITELLIKFHGIDVSKYDETFLHKSIEKRLSAAQCGSLDEYFELLEQNNNERNNFIDSLHVNYSEFFRNPLTFAVLEKVILPSLIQKNKNSNRKEIRIWSAACASGQEAYSIAILLEELKNGGSSKYDYRIFATDQSQRQLEIAKKGLYSSEAIIYLTLKRAGEWFVRHGETYTVKPELKGNIDFSAFDLFSEQLSSPPASIFGEFDIVFCANILFYYKKEYQKIILDKISNSLAGGGFIVTGEVERDILLNLNYKEVFPQSAIFRAKNQS